MKRSYSSISSLYRYSQATSHVGVGSESHSRKTLTRKTLVKVFTDEWDDVETCPNWCKSKDGSIHCCPDLDCKYPPDEVSWAVATSATFLPPSCFGILLPSQVFPSTSDPTLLKRQAFHLLQNSSAFFLPPLSIRTLF